MPLRADALDHGRQYAFRDRKTKRNYRALWQVRINAAARAAGITYSRFMEGLKAPKWLSTESPRGPGRHRWSRFCRVDPDRPKRPQDEGRKAQLWR